MTGTLPKAVVALLAEVELVRNRDNEHRYWSLDLEDQQLISKLRSRSAAGPLTLADLDAAIAEMEAEFMEWVRKEAAFHKQCIERREDLRVFYVINTAGNKLTVLAKDSRCARFFANSHGHIKERTNGRVLVLKPEKERELRSSGKALGRALRDGCPGVVTELGDNVVMEGSKKVYTPMTIVE